jgi:Tol biopolymer transport system component
MLPTGTMSLSRTLPRAAFHARAALVAAALAVLAACDGTGSGPVVAVAAAGRLERGATVTLSATRDGVAIPAAEVTWSATPADAVTLTTDGHATFLRAGNVTISASASGDAGHADFTVAVPPTVVFDRVVSGNRDIWSVSLDGGELTRITTDPGDDQDPSAAHGLVAFTSFRGGSADIFTVPLTGGANTQLTSETSFETSPSLARDGTKIAYTSDVTGLSRVWVMSSTGSGATAATGNFGQAGSIEAGPSWNPGGTGIAFVSTASGGAQLYTASVPGGPPAQLTGTTSTASVEPAYSPDGTRVAFTSDRDGDTEIYLVTVATGAVTRVTNRPGADAQPAWLTDGRLVYTVFTGGTPSLRWLDPAAPADVHTIPTGTGDAQRPSGVL